MTRTALFSLLCLSCAASAAAAAAVPPPRLARRLQPDRAAAAEAAARHNRALKAFFFAAGLPEGTAVSNVLLRAETIERLSAALTNAAGRAEQPLLLRLKAEAAERRPAGADGEKQQTR